MAILQFERTAKGSIPISSPITREEAQDIVVSTIASRNLDCEYSGDCFQEMNDIPVPKDINMKCFCGPFQVDRKYIEVDCDGPDTVGNILFEVKQQCLFFANGVDTDTAITMANVASVADAVEHLPMVEGSTNDHWEIVAPAGIPQSLLVACIAHYLPDTKALRHKSSAKAVAG